MSSISALHAVDLFVQFVLFVIVNFAHLGGRRGLQGEYVGGGKEQHGLWQS